MLILTRREGKSIRIGDDIAVTVFSVRGNQLHLGIEAPKDIPIRRIDEAERIIAGHSSEPTG